MAISWDVLRTTQNIHPPLIVLYGGEGTGKTSFAGNWPNPFYVQIGSNERPPDGVEMMTFGLTETYQEFIEQCEWMLEAEHDRMTFVVDTGDGLEALAIDEACRRQGWKTISDGKFAEPKNATAEVWREIRDWLIKLKVAGFAVIIICHVKTKTEPGVTSDSYPRYRINFRMDDDANSLAHAADIVGFIHQRMTIAKETGGFHKDNVKKRGAGSGERLIAVEELPGFIAKNRMGLHGALKYEEGQGYEMFRPYIVEPYPRPPIDDETHQEAA